ncbi:MULTISPECIES: CRISPR-associated endonuclease Cas1 [Campylobacter]|uniref:CRISPR-associated endonuclease Cas1 n=1 Tax=Campylobacter TaxID=194 RepID=UPI00027A3771|nr:MULTISPECIES: CRISPR-associated endonuclease Cas1 [Campylobacter]EJP76283.1 CRISPR associated protein Cas1-like protein [Campylobacter sp. FOBRC14]
MQKSDRTHFILSSGRLRRQDNNIYFDKFDETGGVTASKILPINAIDEIYILARVELDTYTLAFLADNNILLHVFSPFQSFRGNFYPSTSNSVNKSGFVLLSQLRAFDDPVKRVYIAREITRAHMLNDAANYRALSLHLDLAEIFKPILGDTLIFAMLNKKEITAKDFQTDAGRIKFSNDAIQKIEMKMISRLSETIALNGQNLTWRQVIRREANQLKKCICEDMPYVGFVWG